MKLTSLTAILIIASGLSQLALAHETLYGFGFSKNRGVVLLKDLVEVCHQVSARVKTVDSKGSAVIDETKSSEVVQAIETAIEPLLQRYGVPVSKCSKEDYKSTTMAVFTLAVSVKPNNSDRELLEVRVNSDLSEVVKSIRADRYVRAIIHMANNVKMTRDKEGLVLSITKTSMGQANRTANLVAEQKAL